MCQIRLYGFKIKKEYYFFLNYRIKKLNLFIQRFFRLLIFFNFLKKKNIVNYQILYLVLSCFIEYVFYQI